MLTRIKFLLLPALIILLGSTSEVKAQNYRFDYGVQLGAANILGEMGGKFLARRDFVSDIKLETTGLSAGAFARYAIKPHINLNFAFNWGRVRGADSLSTNPGRVGRNLSFRNDIKEVSLTVEAEIYERYNVGGNFRYRLDYTLYLYGGLGYYFHNPKAYYNGVINGVDYTGWLDLQPLQTEGVAYSLSGTSTILGVGMFFTLDRNFRIGWKLGVRTTQSDYLDDASTNYLPEGSFANTQEGLLAAELANRTPESLPYKNSYRGGAKRGNDEEDDSYVFSSFSFSYVIKGKSGKYNRAFHNGYVRKKGKKVRINRFFDF